MPALSQPTPSFLWPVSKTVVAVQEFPLLSLEPSPHLQRHAQRQKRRHAKAICRTKSLSPSLVLHGAMAAMREMGKTFRAWILVALAKALVEGTER